MNKYLPTIDELSPITDDRKTFSSSVFQKEFNDLNLYDKVQILTDIVRQTILCHEFPDPITEKESLIGDNFTAAIVLKDYILSLNVAQKVKLAEMVVPFYQNVESLEKRYVVLIEKDNEVIFANPEVNIGYTCGEVYNVNFDDNITITEIDADMIKRINHIRCVLNLYTDGKIEKKALENMLAEIEGEPHLMYYKNKIMNTLGMDYNNDYKISSYGHEKLSEWKSELDYLKTENLDTKRQYFLSQYLVGELKKIDSSYNEKIVLNKENYNINYLNSRFFNESNLNLVLIKPSSYYFGLESEIIDEFVVEGVDIVDEKNVNMGMLSSRYQLDLMEYFHPHGWKYKQSMTGPNKLLLINDSAENIYLKKKKLRERYNALLEEKEVLWYDENYIKLDPIITNFIHGTDDCCETALHYTSVLPEYQVVNRYMYPNYKLKEKRK